MKSQLLIDSTNQRRKLRVSGAIIAVGLALCAFTSWWQPQLSFQAVLALAGVGSLVAAIAALYAVRTIRCPQCSLKWVGWSMSHQPFTQWLHWLNELRACPVCGMTAQFRSNSSLNDDAPKAGARVSLVVSRHVMRRVLIIAALVVATGVVGARSARPLSVYFWPAATASIEDASRTVDITLHAPLDVKSVYALDVVGVGRIEGEAEIALVLNGAPYKPRHLDGAVLFTWGGDWYGPEAVVRYTPSSGANGVITLNYRFRSL